MRHFGFAVHQEKGTNGSRSEITVNNTVDASLLSNPCGPGLEAGATSAEITAPLKTLKGVPQLPQICTRIQCHRSLVCIEHQQIHHTFKHQFLQKV